MALPLAASLAAHALVAATFFVGSHFAWPSLPLPIEVVPMHRATKQLGPEDRRGDPRSTERPKPTGAAPIKPHPKAPSATVSRPPPATTDLRPYAPESANLVVLLRADKLRQSPHREAIDAILQALPDYGSLLSGTGLKPIDDFEALLIATADPQDVTATFLAARYRDSAKIRAIFSRPLENDPRVFRVLRPGLAVLTRPDDAARLDDEKSLDANDPRSKWLQDLERFDRVAREENGPAVMVTLADAPALIRLGDGLPTPLAIALATTADASPALRAQLVVASDADAEQLEQSWPRLVKQFRMRTALLGLSAALDDLKIDRKNNVIDLSGHVPEAQLRLALSFARAFLPHPPVDEPAPPR